MFAHRRFSNDLCVQVQIIYNNIVYKIMFPNFLNNKYDNSILFSENGKKKGLNPLKVTCINNIKLLYYFDFCHTEITI